jgi:hypothetical protein
MLNFGFMCEKVSEANGILRKGRVSAALTGNHIIQMRGKWPDLRAEGNCTLPPIPLYL